MPSEMPAWFDESGYVILVVCGLVVAHELYRAVRYRFARHDGLFTAIGLLWGVGLGCKVAGIGPDVLRYWLADIGFPLALSWILWELVSRRRYDAARKAADTEVQALAVFRRKIVGRRHALIAAVLLSYCYELVSGMLAKVVNDSLPPGSAKVVVGEFDWLDIAAYTLGGVIGLLIIWRWLTFADSFAEGAATYDRQQVVWRDTQAVEARMNVERERRKLNRRRGKPYRRHGKH